MKKQLLSSVAAILTASSLFAQLPVSQTADNKNVVLEEFTGMYCTFCPDGHKIAQQLHDAHPDDVVLINIHTGGFADPDPGDPDFRTPFGAALASQSQLAGYPAGTVNRHYFGHSQQGAPSGATALGRGDWSSDATTVLGEASYANVALEGSLDVQTRELTINVEVYYTGNGSATNKLNVAILQDHVEGPQTGASSFNPSQILPNGNYDHMHMLRHLVTGQWGDDITTTTQGTLVQRTYTYTIPADLNGVPYELGNLSIVAFLAEGQQEVITGAEGPINIIIPNGYTEVDLASTTNMASPSTYCDNNVTPEITVSNAGTNDVTAYEVSYTLNNGTPVTQTINTTLAAGASNTVTFPAITLPVGENKLAYKVNPLANSTYIELVTGNNQSASNVIYTMPTTTFASMHSEDFESMSLGDDTPLHAISDNPDAVSAFVVTNAINNSVNQELGGFGNSSKSYRWDFYSIPSGKGSKIVFEKLDFTNGTGHEVRFSHAYAQYQTENDKLQVMVSTDCGATWNTVFSKQGADLSTAPANTDRFYPAVTQWKSDTVDLSAYSGQSDIMIAFEGVSAYGNDLYLDDIQILDGIAASINDETANVSVNAYPNPSNGVVNFAVNTKENAIVSIAVFNSLGELVLSNPSQNIASGTNNLIINMQELKNGIYFANVTVNGQTTVKQISILK